jgi:hypothetical protein
VLRGIFGHKRNEEGSWRKLHNDEVYSLYSSWHILRVIKSRRVKWARHVVRMGREELFSGFWLGRSKLRDHWEDLGVGEGKNKDELREIWIDGVKWILLAQDRIRWHTFVNMAMNLGLA